MNRPSVASIMTLDGLDITPDEGAVNSYYPIPEKLIRLGRYDRRYNKNRREPDVEFYALWDEDE